MEAEPQVAEDAGIISQNEGGLCFTDVIAMVDDELALFLLDEVEGLVVLVESFAPAHQSERLRQALEHNLVDETLTQSDQKGQHQLQRVSLLGSFALTRYFRRWKMPKRSSMMSTKGTLKHKNSVWKT